MFLLIDYRKKENREQGFLQWYEWSLKYKDCDPALWMLNYLFDRFEHNIEQKYWVSWIYGTTYHLPTAWIIWNEFPDFELVDYDRLVEWNNKNYPRLRYQTDTKYNKGYLAKQFASYKRWIEHNNPHKTQDFKFEHYKKLNNFDVLWNAISKNLYKFGRYTTWFYMQTLKQCVNVDIQPDNLKLNDYSGSKSHRNGLCFAVGKDSWVNQKLNHDCISFLEYKAKEIQSVINSNYKSDLYNLETVLCSYKKIFRKTNGRYLGYYLDRQAEEIKKVEQDGWNGIDWQVFWDGRKETLDHNLHISKNIKKHMFPVFLDTGDFKRNECPI